MVKLESDKYTERRTGPTKERMVVVVAAANPSTRKTGKIDSATIAAETSRMIAATNALSFGNRSRRNVATSSSGSLIGLVPRNLREKHRWTALRDDGRVEGGVGGGRVGRGRGEERRVEVLIYGGRGSLRERRSLLKTN